MQLSLDTVADLKREFVDNLTKARDIFGPKPFYLPPGEKGRVRISAALYDATLVAIQRQSKNSSIFAAKASSIKERLAKEFKNTDSGPILTGQGNTAQAVKDRIELLEKILLQGSGLA